MITATFAPHEDSVVIRIPFLCCTVMGGSATPTRGDIVNHEDLGWRVITATAQRATRNARTTWRVTAMSPALWRQLEHAESDALDHA